MTTDRVGCMTPDQINDRLARMMGDTFCYISTYTRCWMLRTECGGELWNPCAYVEQMEMCWQRMEKQGWDSLTQASWVLRGEKLRLHYYRNLCKHRVEGLPFGEAKGSNEARVGCQAMIAALDAEEEAK